MDKPNKEILTFYEDSDSVRGKRFPFEGFLTFFKSAQIFLTRIESVMLVICMLSMSVFVSLLLMGRYFNMPFPWAQEATQYFLIYLVFWGASKAAYTESHIGTSMFLKMFPEKQRKFLSFVGPILFMSFGIIFGIVSLKYVLFTSKMGRTTSTLPYNLSFTWILLPMCISFFSISFHVLIQFMSKFLSPWIRGNK